MAPVNLAFHETIEENNMQAKTIMEVSEEDEVVVQSINKVINTQNLKEDAGIVKV